jgi:hypothetical protein
MVGGEQDPTRDPGTKPHDVAERSSGAVDEPATLKREDTEARRLNADVTDLRTIAEARREG